MNEAINMLMQSGFFYEVGEQIGERLAAKIKEALLEVFKPLPSAQLESLAPTILPEIGKSYEFDTADDALQVCGTVASVDYPLVRLTDYGGVINLNHIAYYFERETKPRI